MSTAIATGTSVRRSNRLRHKQKSRENETGSSPAKRTRQNEAQHPPTKRSWKDSAEYKEIRDQVRKEKAEERAEQKRERERDRKDAERERELEELQLAVTKTLSESRAISTGTFQAVSITITTEGQRKTLQMMAQFENQSSVDNFNCFHKFLSSHVPDLKTKCKTIEVPLAKSEKQLYKGKRRVINSEFSFKNAITRSNFHQSLDIITPRNCNGVIPVYISLQKPERHRRGSTTTISEAALLLNVSQQQSQQQPQ